MRLRIKIGKMVTYYTSTYLAFEQSPKRLRFSWSKLFTMLLGNEEKPMRLNYQALQILLGAITLAQQRHLLVEILSAKSPLRYHT